MIHPCSPGPQRFFDFIRFNYTVPFTVTMGRESSTDQPVESFSPEARLRFTYARGA